MNDDLPDLPEPLLRHLTARRDAAQAQVDRLTAELADAQQLLTRLDVTYQTLLAITGRQEPPEHQPAPPQLPPGYADLLTILARNSDGMRPKEVALALGLPATSKNTIEGIRAKLKRLVGRDLATEPQPGIFTIKPTNN